MTIHGIRIDIRPSMRPEEQQEEDKNGDQLDKQNAGDFFADPMSWPGELHGSFFTSLHAIASNRFDRCVSHSITRSDARSYRPGSKSNTHKLIGSAQPCASCWPAELMPINPGTSRGCDLLA